MRDLVLPALLAVAAAFAAGVARAEMEAPSPRFQSDEVSLRLVAAPADADGGIRAALLIDLAPGWKTYWIDPGEAGIPPRIDLSASRNIVPEAILYPAPHRFGDADSGLSNGYAGALAVALRFAPPAEGARAEIHASVLLGLCETICIPLSAELTLPLGSAGDRGLVDAAFAALPVEDDGAAGVREARFSADGGHIIVSASGRSTSDDAIDLFLAGPKGWSFGVPTRVDAAGDAVTFAVPVDARPRHADPGALSVDAVLVSAGRAVERRGLPVWRPEAEAARLRTGG